MKAEIITIGDEILIGQIVDTNSAWMAEQLNLAGVEVERIVTVHDRNGQIEQELASAEGKVDVVLMTGGLGPTNDDITKMAWCAYFRTKLVFHQPTYDTIRQRFTNRGIDLNKLNRDQALVPENCTVLPNSEGTAPVLWYQQGGTIFVAMPGVPFEMQAIMQQEVLPRLKATGKTNVIIHKTVLTQGVPESMLAMRIAGWENKLPSHIKLAYLPNPMMVRLRLSAYGDNEDGLSREIGGQVEQLKALLPVEIFGFDEDTLAGSLGGLLKARNATVSVAESCTGGFIAHLITSVPGASNWFTGSVTAYDNNVKCKVLGVKSKTIEKFGAVSEQVVFEMAHGIKNLLKTDYSIATTGIAGPDGGTFDKPVGTIWISVAGPTKFKVKKYVYSNNRERNIVRSSQTALQLLRKLILEE